MFALKIHFVVVFCSQINVFHENQDFRFSAWLIHSMESMESIDSMISMDSMESMESIEPMESEVKYTRWRYGTIYPTRYGSRSRCEIDDLSRRVIDKLWILTELIKQHQGLLG